MSTSASVDVMTNQTLSFAGLIGNDTILRVTDGTLCGLVQRFDPPEVVYDYRGEPIVVGVGKVWLELKIAVGSNGYSLARGNDPYNCLPIGDKRVDDCTIEELLFAVKHKLTK